MEKYLWLDCWHPLSMVSVRCPQLIGLFTDVLIVVKDWRSAGLRQYNTAIPENKPIVIGFLVIGY